MKERDQHNKNGLNRFRITPYLFIAPHVLIFIAFFLIPMIYGIYASFTK